MKLPFEIVIPNNIWLLKDWVTAITLPPFIFYHGKPDKQTRCHEFVHWAQAKRYTWLGFYILYLWYSIRHKYMDNPMEKEAYSKQDNC